MDGKPAGSVSIWFRDGSTKDRHIAWLGIHVRRRYWGKGVGSGLMKEAIKFAKESGFRRLMLGTTEGNERAIRLYQKFGFKTEALENDEVYIDRTWRKNYIMGLDLAPCEPKANLPSASQTLTVKVDLPARSNENIRIRQLMNRDLDEVNSFKIVLNQRNQVLEYLQRRKKKRSVGMRYSILRRASIALPILG